MAVRIFVEDATDILTSSTENADIEAPTGFTAVLLSVMEAAYTGKIYMFGKWDGAAYTPPAYISDALTDLGTRKTAARLLHDYLVAEAAALAVVAVYHPATHVARIHDFHTFAHHACYVVFNSDTYDTDAQIKWAEEMASGPTDGQTTFAWVQVVSGLDDDAIPTSACTYVDPTDGTRGAIADAVMNSGTWFTNEDTSLSGVDPVRTATG